MCGIAGYARAFSSPLELEDEAVLARMTAALEHRGPDAEGYLIRDRVAMGHRRLAIIDIAGGAQPMRADTFGLSVVFNGEIYNYRQLNAELHGLGFGARTRSDTETILNAYAAWGEDCVRRFNGMFAFVIHDRRRRRLFGARDRVGEKPLYLVHAGPFFAFASEPKALLEHPAVGREMDPDAAARFLLFEHVPAPRAIYKGMTKLLAGHRFGVDLNQGRLSIDAYWDLASDPPTPPEATSDEEWVRRLRERLTQAVERRLIADVPLGVFLSGGIDSSAITAIMVRLQGHRQVKTFSIGFNDPRFDESPWAQRVAEHFSTDHHHQRLGPRDVLDALPTVAAMLDEPFADPSILPTYLLAKFTRRHVTVALGGDGGDELFGGYQTFRALPFARAYNTLVPAALHRRVVRPMAGCLRASHGYFSLDFKLKQFLRGVKVPRGQRLWRWLGAMVPEELAWLLTPEALAGIDLDALYAPVTALHSKVLNHDDIGQDSFVFIKTYLADGILTKVDRATMACSLEARSPLLDHELVELANAIPSRLKVRRGKLKHIFRQALEGLLPQDLLNRPKQGFAVPLGAWFRGPLREMLLETLSERALREGGFLRPEAVKQLLREHMAGRCDHRKPLFALFMLQQWRHNWLERPTASSPRPVGVVRETRITARAAA